MKRAHEVTARCCASFPSQAEQYQETLGTRFARLADFPTGRRHPQGADTLDLNELLVKRPAATFFVKVQGESMIGEGIHDGDLLVVDRSLRPASGDVIIACVDGDFTVKTLRLGNGEWGTGNGGEVRLVAANPNYPDIVLKPGQELDYFGKVTACIHQFKKGK